MSRMYFADAATEASLHTEHIEHDEIDLTDQELRGLKRRARRAVTMDGSQASPGEPEAYQRWLTPHLFDRPSYDEWLGGKNRR